MTALPVLDVVIVNWNSGPHLAACVASLLSSSATQVRLGDVIVVDNASTDGSADDLVGNPTVRVVRNSANLGFARACNIGAQAGRGTHILFLNPDTIVAPECIDRLFFQLRHRDDVAIIGPRLVDAAGRTSFTCSRFPSLSTVFAKTLGLEKLLARFGWSQPMLEFDHLQSKAVDQVIGAFLIVDRDVYVSVGGFDETYFMYYEEVDLCRRVRNLGRQVLFCADAVATHVGGASSRSVPVKRMTYNLRSRLHYYKSNFSTSRFWVATALTLLVEPVTRLGQALVTGSIDRAAQTLRAYATVYRQLAHEGSGATTRIDKVRQDGGQ